MFNTSQDPEYYGPTGHEVKFHKTHFGVVRTLKKKQNPKTEWVQFAPGKFKLVKKENEDGKENESIGNRKV